MCFRLIRRRHRLRYPLLHRTGSRCLGRLLLFLLLSQRGLHRIGFRRGRALRRRWPTRCTQVFTLLLLQIFTVSGSRFRCFRYVIWMLLLRSRILVVVQVVGGTAVLQLLRLLHSDCGDGVLLLLLL